MKKYEILGGNLPVVVCELSAGESMITESGSMSWMSPNMKMETISGGGMKKMFGRLMSGDSAFQNRYTAEGADGMIAFASSFPGAIKECIPCFRRRRRTVHAFSEKIRERHIWRRRFHYAEIERKWNRVCRN